MIIGGRFLDSAILTAAPAAAPDGLPEAQGLYLGKVLECASSLRRAYGREGDQCSSEKSPDEWVER